jgi:hypothetical protein
MKHTPLSAARAVRVLEEENIAKTWAQYDEQQREAEHIQPSQRAFSGRRLNAYKAGVLVKEQANCTFRQAMRAVQRVMPELFANGYWETLPMDWETQDWSAV